ncbi:MAG: J domain-containing protein [Hyphomicrobiaceae bacterium]
MLCHLVAFVGLLVGIVFVTDFDKAAIVVAASMGGGAIVAWLVPAYVKLRHVRSQNRLLDRCRALYLLGGRSVDRGDTASAERILTRIRRIERIWRLGNSILFRITLALWGIVGGVVCSILLRLVLFIASPQSIHGTPLSAAMLIEQGQMAVATSIFAPVYAMIGYWEGWTKPWVIDNCGDRLWQMIHGAREVLITSSTFSSRMPEFDGMTPFEVFGLSPDFTRQQLAQARRKLIKTLHPDLWHTASPEERQAREDALKSVNAAYDLLRPLVSR